MSRSSWDEYFMRIAKEASTRATCPRQYVGAVIVGQNRSLLSTGYNGSIRGMSHCEDSGCMMEDGHCVRVTHAEMNAIAQAARNGVRVEGATIYTTASPCWICFRLIANSGLVRIVFDKFYKDDRIFDAAKAAGIELVGARADVV